MDACRTLSQNRAGIVQRNASLSLPGPWAQDRTSASSSSDTGGSCIWSPSITTGTPLENRVRASTREQYPASSRNTLSTSSSILPSSSVPLGLNLEMNWCGVAAMILADAVLQQVPLRPRSSMLLLSSSILPSSSSSVMSRYSPMAAAGLGRSNSAASMPRSTSSGSPSERASPSVAGSMEHTADTDSHAAARSGLCSTSSMRQSPEAAPMSASRSSRTPSHILS